MLKGAGFLTDARNSELYEELFETTRDRIVRQNLPRLSCSKRFSYLHLLSLPVADLSESVNRQREMNDFQTEGNL